MKLQELTPMAVGAPRRTQSLCPDCNREAVEGVLKGELILPIFGTTPELLKPVSH